MPAHWTGLAGPGPPPKNGPLATGPGPGQRRGVLLPGRPLSRDVQAHRAHFLLNSRLVCAPRVGQWSSLALVNTAGPAGAGGAGPRAAVDEDERRPEPTGGPGGTTCPAPAPAPAPARTRAPAWTDRRAVGRAPRPWARAAGALASSSARGVNRPPAPRFPDTVCRRRPWEARGADRPPGYAEASSGRPGRGRGLLHLVTPGWAQPTRHVLPSGILPRQRHATGQREHRGPRQRPGVPGTQLSGDTFCGFSLSITALSARSSQSGQSCFCPIP